MKRHSKMGSSSAGAMFMMRSFVSPSTFSPMPMISSDPVTEIS